MRSPFFAPRPAVPRGFALVLVLAFVALLTGVCLAFFSNALLQRQVSDSSATRVDVDLLAQGAVETTISDLKQEIASGSAPSPTQFADGSLLYTVTDPKRMVPERIGVLATGTPATELPNVLKTSIKAPFSLDPGASNRASDAVTTTPSANGRAVSLERWNKPLLMTPTAPNNAPPASFATVAPNWILVSRDPTNPNPTTPNRDVVGRYAYVIYDEGGLLDINVAGYPGTSTALSTPAVQNDLKRKLGLPSVDLRELKVADTQLLADADIDKLINWRNSVTALKIAGAGTTDAEKSAAFSQYVRSAGGFLQSAGQTISGGRSDSMFVGRHQLIDFFKTQLTDPTKLNALQFLTTFSRGLDQPSLAPALTRPKVLPLAQGGNDQYLKDDLVNPRFLQKRVTTTIVGGRNDGTDLTVGEPLVKKRFPLEYLAWVTYLGPSADAPASFKTKLKEAGIPESVITKGTAQNIEKYFGLKWGAAPATAMGPSPGNAWTYNVHNGAPGAIKTLDEVAIAGREPDFFELLKAAIHVGSLGKSAYFPATPLSVPGYDGDAIPVKYQSDQDRSVDKHIVKIAANIIDQADVDSYPTRIFFQNGSDPFSQAFSGVEDIPYLNYVFNGVLRTSFPNSSSKDGSPNNNPQAGEAVFLQIPTLWNPNAFWKTSDNPEDVNKYRGDPRPGAFRVIAESTDPLGNPHIIYTAIRSGSTPNFHYSYDGTPTGDQHELDAGNTAVAFNDGNGSLLREPTLLIRRSQSEAPTTTAFFRTADFSPVRGVPLDTANTDFTGILIGKFPLSFRYGGSVYWADNDNGMRAGQLGTDPLTPFYLQYKVEYQDESGQWIAYDAKYGRASGGSYYLRWNNDPPNNPLFGSALITQTDETKSVYWASSVDPRTSRFGMLTGSSDVYNTKAPPFRNRTGNPADSSPNTSYTGWMDYNDGRDGITLTQRPDFNGGHYLQLVNLIDSGITSDVPYPTTDIGWTQLLRGASPLFPLGMYSQNNPRAPFYFKRYQADSADTPQNQSAYYADADGVVRRAMGAYVGSSTNQTASTTVGLPQATTKPFKNIPGSIVTDDEASIKQSQSRPIVLNRPFRTVGELGYVFRDTPWKNLDFFTPESGDAGLLDVFCISESKSSEGLVAGKINLNSQQLPVLTAIINSAYIDERQISDGTIGRVSPDLGKAVASSLLARTASEPDLATGIGPLMNVSELVGKWREATAVSGPGTGNLSGGNFTSGELSYSGFSGSEPSVTQNLGTALDSADPGIQLSMKNIQRFREAPIRALAGVGQTRVWNLMVDLVAQSGQYPAGAGAGGFTVQGEQRLWVHLAVDRFTGKVLDKQIEMVKE